MLQLSFIRQNPELVKERLAIKNFTGTGIVPPDTFTLREADKVRIRIDPIGELINTVSVVGKIQESAGGV